MRLVIFIFAGEKNIKKTPSSFNNAKISVLTVSSSVRSVGLGRINFSQSWLSRALQKIAKGILRSVFSVHDLSVLISF